MSFKNFMRKLDGKHPVPEKKRSGPRSIEDVPGLTSSSYVVNNNTWISSGGGGGILQSLDPVGESEESYIVDEWDDDADDDFEPEPEHQTGQQQEVFPTGYSNTYTLNSNSDHFVSYHYVYFSDGSTGVAVGPSPNDTPDGAAVSPVPW